MLRHSFLCVFFLLFIAGCARPPMIPPSASHQQVRHMPAFTRVKVDGTINVSLHTGYSRPQVILRGDPRDLVHVTTVVVNGGLLVNLGKGYPNYGPVQAEIRGKFLNSFEYHGRGYITGKRLRSSLLDILIDNDGKTTLGGNITVRKLKVMGGGYTQISGVRSERMQVKLSGKARVQLSGVVNVTSIDVDNGSWLSMYWVKSRVLKVCGRGASFIQLAGITDRLDVELWDKACFKGRYLRANRAFVKTYDKAVAEISAINRQHTLASGGSDILFYNIPEMRTDFMAFDGSVLDMRDLNIRDWRMPLQEYNRYNK